ncbi:MAG: carboxylesterase/lipase family protein [Blautia sp.]|nr:carboxylesterase/lipase family protein [Blautia sp.]
MEEVIITSGRARFAGERRGEACCFYGIPFAEAGRWQRARAVTYPVDTCVHASGFGPSPWQPENPAEFCTPAGLAEDCLNLNLFVSRPQESGKAVLLWVYGGAQVMGSNTGPRTEAGSWLFDGADLVTEHPDVLVVVPNYRVGTWGSANLSFFPDFREEYRFANNLARLDILECLRWVRKNIASFGGDPDRITLAGQSAGAANLSSLLLMPEAKGEIHRVLCESSFCMDMGLTSFDDSVRISRAFFEEAGVHTLAEALAMTSGELLEAQQKLLAASMGGSPVFRDIPSKLFSPVVDREVIFDDYWDYLAAEGCRGVSFLGGTNEGEYDQQFEGFEEPRDLAKVRDLVMDHCFCRLKDKDALIGRYLLSGPRDRTELEAWMDLKRDIYLRVPSVCYAELFSKNGAGSWLYFLKGQEGSEPGRLRFRHASEIPMLFKKPCPYPEEVSMFVRENWLAFVRSGRPGASWPPYGEEKETMVITEHTHMENGIRVEDIELLKPLCKEFTQGRKEK